MKQSKVLGIILSLAFLIALNSCKKLPYGVLKDNIPPTIELINVSMIPDSILLQTIDSLCTDSLANLDTTCVDSLINVNFGGPRLVHWRGTDMDGRVAGYWFTFQDTTHSFAPKYNITIVDDDTLYTPIPVEENLWNWTYDSTSLTVKLPSMDSLDAVTFYVIAEDDDGALSLQGTAMRIASAVFLRKNNEVPTARIDTLLPPPIDSEVFVLPETTLTWKGVIFRVSAFEIESITGDTFEQSIPYEFSYAWDVPSNWSSWSTNDEYVFTKGNTPEFATDGLHTFYVRTRDDALAVGTVDSCSIITVTPTLNQGVIVIDASRNGSGSPGLPTDQQVDDFYSLILTQAGLISFATFENSTKNTPPNPVDLAPYSTVIYHSDDFVLPKVKEQDALMRYLDIGGNLMIGGQQVISGSGLTLSHLQTYFGVDAFDVKAESDFQMARPVPGYPALMPDSSKLGEADNLFGREGKMSKVGIVSATDFTHFETLYLFDSATNDPNFECSSGCMVGFRFKRPFKADPVTGDTVEFSRTTGFTFPLYPIKVDPGTGEPMTTVAREILEFFGEL